MTRHVTMADVAREAGVSLMTVSRAVNNKDGISEATRQRIQAIADRLGYRPSLVARGLVTERTNTIGLVVIDNANPFFSEVARGVEHAVYDAGYNVFLSNTEEDPQREIDVLRSLEEQRVAGVVLCSSRLSDDQLLNALKAHPATVLINRALAGQDYGSVLIADRQGARLVVEHLLRAGHRAIGFLAGPERSYSGQQRMSGYRAALAEVGVTPDPDWHRHCLPVVDSGREAADDLLRHHTELTALFCYNDLTAIGALQACKELGRRVPADLAIAGFDDILLARLVTPTLTTCRVPMYNMGRTALQMLVARIDSGAAACTTVEYQPELIIRNSAPGAHV